MTVKLWNLPNEILYEHILRLVENTDINTLCGIPVFRERLMMGTLLIRDPTMFITNFPNIPRRMGPTDFCPELLCADPRKKGIWRIIVDVRWNVLDGTHSIGRLLNESEKLNFSDISIFSGKTEIDGSKQQLFPIFNSRVSETARTITFVNVTSMSLRNHTFNPGPYRFPSLQSLTIYDCCLPARGAQRKAGYNMPVLKELAIRGNKDMFDRFDFTKLKSLQDLEISTTGFKVLEIPEGLSELKRMTFGGDIEHLKDVSLPGLETCTFSSALCLKKITNLRLPSVRTLTIKTQANLSIDGLEVDNAVKLYILARKLTGISNIQCPNASDVFIDTQYRASADANIDWSFLSNVTTIGCTKQMDILDVNTRITNLTLWGLKRIPSTSHPFLTAMALSIRQNNTLNFQKLEKFAPLLDTLIVYAVNPVNHLSRWSHQNLKTLRVKLHENSSLIMTDASFPQLRHFEASGSVGDSIYSSFLSIIEFEAPNLRSFILRGCRTLDLDLTLYSQLRALVIQDSEVGQITIPESTVKTLLYLEVVRVGIDIIIAPESWMEHFEGKSALMGMPSGHPGRGFMPKRVDSLDTYGAESLVFDGMLIESDPNQDPIALTEQPTTGEWGYIWPGSETFGEEDYEDGDLKHDDELEVPKTVKTQRAEDEDDDIDYEAFWAPDSSSDEYDSSDGFVDLESEGEDF